VALKNDAVRIMRQDYLASEQRHQPVLVVVFLRGGADALTIVPPHGDDAYHRARPSLAISGTEMHDLDGHFGLHKAMGALMPLWKERRLSVHHGVGAAEASHSHFQAQDLVEHGGSGAGGWIARYLRARAHPVGPLASVAIGSTWPESLRGAPGGAVIQSIEDFAIADDDPDLIRRLERLHEGAIGGFGEVARSTLTAMQRLREIRAEGIETSSQEYPDTPLGRGLREIARLIRADVGLMASTVDSAGAGFGWDTHFVQNLLIPLLMKDLSDSIAAFMGDLGEHAPRTRVVVLSEFGRRVSENTSFGTDHGSGGIMMMVGDDLPRPGVHSGFSDLEDQNLIGPGDVPVGRDYRELLVELIGSVDPTCELPRVFPDVPSAG
jgi:uncharacterized protein (DUF1501 family)